MRNFIVAAIASLLTSNYAGAQQKASTPAAPPDPGFACFETLSTPEYPKTALQAHVDGSIWTWIQVSPQGSVDKVDTQVVSAYSDAAKLLKPPVETAMRASKFKSDCSGKRVWVVFRYQLYGEPTANPQVKARREEPNILWIESQPAAATVAGKR
jgi:hypothetical protein